MSNENKKEFTMVAFEGRPDKIVFFVICLYLPDRVRESLQVFHATCTHWVLPMC